MSQQLENGCLSEYEAISGMQNIAAQRSIPPVVYLYQVSSSSDLEQVS